MVQGSGFKVQRLTGIKGFRNLGIEGILSLLNFSFCPFIPQFPNS